MNNEQITIKIRPDYGCFHREHSPVAYQIIDDYLATHKDSDYHIYEHESGPEIIAWLALGTASITLAKSVFDFITAIINARAKGRDKGDTKDGKLQLIIRDTIRTKNSTEEIVLEVYDKEKVSTEEVQTAIEKILNRNNSVSTKGKRK